MARPSFVLRKFLEQPDEGLLLVAFDIEAMAAEGIGNPGHDALLVAEIIRGGVFAASGWPLRPQVKVGGDQAFGRSADIGGHADGLEQNLRAGDGAADIQDDPASARRVTSSVKIRKSRPLQPPLARPSKEGC